MLDLPPPRGSAPRSGIKLLKTVSVGFQAKRDCAGQVDQGAADKAAADLLASNFSSPMFPKA